MKKYRCIQVLINIYDTHFRKLSCISFFPTAASDAHFHIHISGPVGRRGSALGSSAVKPEAEMRR